MKKTLAALLVVGALAVAGLSATAAVSANGDNAGQTIDARPYHWPNTTTSK